MQKALRQRPNFSVLIITLTMVIMNNETKAGDIQVEGDGCKAVILDGEFAKWTVWIPCRGVVEG